MQDQTLRCIEVDCPSPNHEFVWTASEQEFFASKGFSAPVRCPECRKRRKAAKQGGDGGGRFDRERAPRAMHKITCAQCGAEGEVPFQPRNPDDVLCADCFRKKRDAERGIISDAPAAYPVAAPVTTSPADDTDAADDTAEEVATEVTETEEDDNQLAA